MKVSAHIGLFVTASAVMLSSALLLPRTAVAKIKPGQYPAVHASLNDVANGGILLLQIDTGALQLSDADMRIDFNDRSYQVYRHPAGEAGLYFALIGIPYRTRPGPQKLTLNYSDATVNKRRLISFQVVAGKYKTDLLKVDGGSVSFPRSGS